jgi:hypothetical protein
MAGRFIQGEVRWRTGPTDEGPLDVPHIVLPIVFVTSSGPQVPIDCQWDSGSELSLMSERVARAIGIDLDGAEETTFISANGERADAWLVRRWVRFPALSGWRFKLLFIVHKGSDDPLPLLGMLDTHRLFDLVSHGGEYFFFLAADPKRHHGEPC